MAKIALKFGCAKQSKNLEWYLVYVPLLQKKICSTLPITLYKLNSKNNFGQSENRLPYHLLRCGITITNLSNITFLQFHETQNCMLREQLHKVRPTFLSYTTHVIILFYTIISSVYVRIQKIILWV